MKSKNDMILQEKVDQTKIALIKHYMAEKGQDAADFDVMLADEINKLIDRIYVKLVPKQVRQLISSDFALTKKEKKHTKKHESEEIENGSTK